MSTIPASLYVNATASVLSAGGAAFDLLGLCLTKSTRVPIGTVQGFPNAASVQSYFGIASPEANDAAIYFGGFNNSTKKPSSMNFVQYPANAVAAYLRGGNISSLTLLQLQALSGSLSVVMDGYTRAANSINLSGASSFSTAAAIIQAALNAAAPSETTVTASIATNTAVFTASIAGTVMYVSNVSAGTLVNGGTVTGSGVVANTLVTGQLSGTPGGAGTYAVTPSQVVASEPMTETFGLLTVSNVASGVLAVGQTVYGTGVGGSGVTAGTVITQLGTGTGSVGTYYVNNGQTATVASTVATPLTVAYDSVSGAFVITSGVSGAASTSAFATGTLATPLDLTSATGAVLSQGAAPVMPSEFMNGVVATTTNFATFFTNFDPDGGSGNVQKQAFDAWNNTQTNDFGYICWDTDASPTVTVPATSSLGYILQNNSSSGTCPIYEPSNLFMAAFISGAAASIDFDQINGRITFAYKWQSGLTAGVTSEAVAVNLGGDPKVPGSFGNGYNYGGAVGTANANFQFFQRGTVTGPWKWFDSYLYQIWLRNQFQNDLLTLLTNVNSIPYNNAGNALIDAALQDTIDQGLSFGMYSAGVTLSAAQVVEVNAQAGTKIAPTLQSQGWYLQVLPSSPQTRASRASPPCTFWYVDGGSVQSVQISSVALQ